MQPMRYLCWFLVGLTTVSFEGKPGPQFKPDETPWDSLQLARARKAATCTYMNTLEMDVLYYTNLARIHPARFEATILKEYIISHSLEKSTYVKSLQKLLKKLKPTEVLNASQDVYNAARIHAEKSGKKGTIGHQGLDARMKTHAPGRKVYGENCDYGNDNALDIFMSWLIDEGIPGLSHRKNLLNEEFTVAGIAVLPHKKMMTNAVMCFAK